MAVQDTPINTEAVRMEDNPISVGEVPKTKSEERDSFEIAQAAFLDNYISGNSVLDNYNYYASTIDKAAELSKLSQQKAEMDAGDVAEEFVINPYGTTGSIEEQAQAVSQAISQVRNQSTDPDRQFTETLVGDRIDEEALKQEVANAKMYKMVADWQEEIGTSDVVMDVVAGMLPFVQSIRGYRVTGSYFGADDEIKAAISTFKNLPAEEQLQLFPRIKAELEEKAGPLAGIQILNNFLTPLGEENPQPFDDVDRAFDILDVTGMAWAFGTAIKNIKGGYNVAKAAKNLGNEDTATDISIAAAADDELARAAGMDTTTATGNLLPFDISIEDIGHSGELSGPAMEKLKKFFGEVDKTSEDIMLGRGFLKEGILNTGRRAEVEAETIAKLKAEQAENIRVVGKDLNETKFSYNVRDEDGEVTEETFTLDLTLNEAGFWDQHELSLVGEYLGSPTAFAKGTLKQDVQTAQRLDFLSSKINRQLLDLTAQALKPIGLVPTPKNRASLAKVDKALIEGDEWKNVDGTRGKVFTPEELREKFSLEENEMSAYYRINRLNNNIFNIRNHEKRQEMIALDYKNVEFTGSGESVAGKVFEKANDAALSVRGRNINYVYDADADELVNIKEGAEGFFKNAYENNKRIVRMEEPYDVGGDRGKVFYAMVNEDEVTDLPQVVLHRKPGYTSRIYDEAAYFVKEITEEVVDGDKTFPRKKTLRFFSNKKEADEFVEQLVAREIADLGADASEQAIKTAEKRARDKYKRLSDREEEILSAATGDIGHGSNGLYTGARAQDDILFGLEGTKPSRLNSFESLVRSVGNVSKFASVNQWRMGLEQRWINTANRIFKEKGVAARIESFERLPSISEASDEVRFLNKMHDQIRDWQNFPSPEEKIWNAGVQKMYDFAYDRGYSRTGKLIGNLRGTDPIATARATAFHSLLGWFNPAQLWVQAQGMMIAASLGFGKYLTRTLGNTIALTSLDTAGVNAASIMSKVAKASGIDKDEMSAIFELWKKTGYRDSVLQTADHAAVSKGYGMSSAIFRKAADTGLMFYRNGELVNRRMSFTTAIERYKEKHKLTSIRGVSDDELKSIMDDANNMMLNMSKANRAQWQKGFLSLPTQFLQVTTKFVETLGGFNKQFTGAERGRMFAGQLALYGTAGIPLANIPVQFAMEVMGVTQQDIENNPGLVKAVNDGFWGATTFWIMGADIEMASRGSLLRGVGDFIDNWFVQESSITEKMLGAFGSTGARVLDSLSHNMKPFLLGGMGAVNWDNAYNLATQPFFDSVSTFRNIEKAWIMNRLDTIYSTKGRPTDSRDFSLTEELMQAMGFQVTSAAESWDLVQWEKAAKSVERKITDYVMLKMNEFAAEHPNGDYSEEDFARYQFDIQAAMASLDPDQALSVQRSIQQAYKSGSRRAEAIERVLGSIRENSVSDMLSIRTALTGSGILRLGIETEEQE